MSPSESSLRFSEAVPIERAQILLKPKSFDEIADELAHVASIPGALRYIDKERSDTTAGAWRPFWHLTAEDGPAEQFFNGTFGYRAAFAISTAEGERINRLLMDKLTLRLLATAEARANSPIAQSLQHEWAKVWIWQKKGQFHESFEPTEPEILVPRWLANRDKAIKRGWKTCEVDRDTRPLDCKAIWGVRLHGPIKVLEIMGSWVDDSGRAVLPTLEKQGRSKDLCEFGYA